MSVQTLPRSARRWSVAIVAAGLASGLTAIVFVFAVGTGSEQSAPSIPATPVAMTANAPQNGRTADPIMSLTPARLAAGAFGTGYALPTVPHGPTTQSVLASMSPETRAYTKAIMSLTFTQLAAGAAGSP